MVNRKRFGQDEYAVDGAHPLCKRCASFAHSLDTILNCPGILPDSPFKDLSDYRVYAFRSLRQAKGQFMWEDSVDESKKRVEDMYE